jgi:protein arginine kinase
VTIEELAKSEGIWNVEVSEKNDADLVLKSSVRFSRNVSGYTFSHRLGETEKNAVNDLLIKTIKLYPGCRSCITYDMNNIPEFDRKIFFERNFLGDDRAVESVLILSEEQNFFFILNYEDHLLLVTSCPGYQIEAGYVNGKKIITSFEKHVEFAFSPSFGYLTSDPEKSGTGMVLSIILHLAGLVHSSGMNELMMDLDKRGLALKGSWIDGYYEVYNRRSIGRSEKQLYEATLSSFELIIQKERQYRKELYERSKSYIEDKVWRSYGTLLSCRTISLFEALELLSNLRLGISLELINYVRIREINLLIHYIQDYHLRKRYNIRDEGVNLEEVRAHFIREFLKEVI